MKTRLIAFLVITSHLLISCSTADYYSVPPDLKLFAVINDDAVKGDKTNSRENAIIISIDRRTIPATRRLITPQLSSGMVDVKNVDFTKSIPLKPGERKLFVEVCENTAFSFIKCARTVVRLNAEPNGRYRLVGSVSVSKDHADIWIENLIDGSLKVDKFRVTGLERK